MWHALIKDHLTQGNLQKTMLSNEKQSNLEKKIHRNISLSVIHK